ncbi:mutator 2 isoform X2 [Andrena cerasifolii]|uniref:mutator 2 isoform X2 n=1 Tax=Andrena cerasifolii TaxID=2819439 RepID=UPI004037AB78
MMDIPPTQVLFDDSALTQRLTQSLRQEPEDEIQVGVLTIEEYPYAIKKGVTQIGRHPNCSIVLDNQTVSKKHAEIEANSSETSAWICDLNSSNKTKLNNTILRHGRWYELKDGSSVDFGMVHGIYTVHRPCERFIPETPVPTCRKEQQMTIPATPDSSLNNSSTLQENISMIPATQAGDEEAIFRRPSVPQRTSNNSRKSFIQDSSAEDSIMDNSQCFGDRGKENGDTVVDIHDVETQKICLVSIRALGKALPKRQIDIHDMETQHEEDVETQCIPTNIHDIDTQHEEDIHKILTPKKSSAKNVSAGKDESISDVENRELGKRKLTADEGKDANNLEQNASEKASTAKVEGATTSTEQTDNVQRGSQENQQLSLSTNFEDESEFDRSRDLLGSQNLFDFVEDDDSLDEAKSKSATSVNKTTENSSDENIFDAATQVKVDDENIFEAATQRIALPFKAGLMDEDSDDTDQEGVFQRYSRKDSQDSAGPAKSQLPMNDDSDTDEEGRFTEIALKEKRESCSFEVRQNVSKETKNDAGSSKDSDNLFDTLTQHVNQKNKDPTAIEGSKADVDFDTPTQVIATNEPEAYTRPESDTDVDVDDLAATQILPSEFYAEASKASVVSAKSKVAVNEEEEDITEMEDNTATQILNFSEKVADADDKESRKSFILIPSPAEERSVEDIDYEMAPTQLLSEIERMPLPNSSGNGKNTPKKSHKVTSDDTLERNLNKMFDDVNEEDLNNQSQISTQVLTNVLQSSQCEDASNDTPNADSRSPEISKVKRFARGRRSKVPTGSVSDSSPGRKSSRSDLNTTANVKSQNTGQYLSALTSPRKRNILVDSQDSVTPIEIVSDNSKAEEPATRSETVDATNKRNSVADAVFKPSPKGVTTPRSRRHEEESKSCKLILDKMDFKSKNDRNVLEESPASENSDTLIGIIPHRRSSILLEDDEDILAGFPEVRISGTLSNPASPTTSSSRQFRMGSGRNRSKQDPKKVAPKKRVKVPRKSVARINVENTEPYRTISKPNSSALLASCGSFDVDRASMPMHESDDEEPAKNTSRRLRKSKGSESLAHEKSVSFAHTQEQATRIPSIQRNVRTRNSTKNNVDRSSVFQVGKEAPVANAELAKITVSNALRVGKRSGVDLNEGSNAKKRKEDVNEDVPAPTKGGRRNARSSIVTRRNPENILNYVVKKSSPLGVETWDTSNLPRSHLNLLSKQFVVKVTRISPSISAEPIAEGIVSNETNQSVRSSVSSQSTLSSLNRTESVVTGQGMERKRYTSQRVGNKRQREVEDINSQFGEESQEVEMIMNASLKVQAIRLEMEKKKDVSEGNTTRTRNARKRVAVNALLDVDLSENSAPSDSSESDNVDLKILAAKANRLKISRSKTRNIADATVDLPTVSATRNSKKPSKSTRGHHKSIADSPVEESTKVSTNETTASSTTGQVTVPKKRGRKPKMKKQEEDIIKDNTSLGMNSSLDTASVLLSMPSRTRRGISSSFTTSSPFKVRHKVLFTGIENTLRYSNVLRKLGASQVEDPTKCSVLVTDKVRRTFKFLCALAQSVPIVTIDWLTDSGKAGQFVELENYILKDPAAEVKFGFKLRGSLDKAREQKLLLGYTVVLTSNVTPPPIPEWKSIISSCSGKPLVRPPATWPEKAVIISTDEDLKIAKKFLANAPKSVTVQSTEFILTGILKQELNFIKYKLT